MNRSCSRQADGFDLQVHRMDSAAPKWSAAIKMIAARHTCFYALFRSATTSSPNTHD